MKAGLLIMRALAEEYVQGKCSKEDLKPKKKEQFKSMVALAKRSPPTQAKAAAMKRPARAPPAATVPQCPRPGSQEQEQHQRVPHQKLKQRQHGRHLLQDLLANDIARERSLTLQLLSTIVDQHYYLDDEYK